MKPEDSNTRVMMGRHKRWVIAAIGASVILAVGYVMTRQRALVLRDQEHVVGFSADGRVLATIDQDGKAYLWDPETGEPRNDLAGEIAGLPFPFSPDGTYHIDIEPTALIQRCVLVETKTGKPIFRFSYPARYPFYQKYPFGFTPDGRYFCSPISDSKGEIAARSVWRLPGGNQIYFGKEVVLAVSPDGEQLAIASFPDGSAKKIELFSIRDQVVESSFDELDSRVPSFEEVAFSEAGDRLVVCWKDMRISTKVLDIRSKQLLAEYEIPGVQRPRFIQNDQLIAIHQGWATGPVAICLADSDHSSSVWNVDALSANDQWGVTAYKARDIPSNRFAIDVFKILPDRATGVTNESPSIRLNFPIEQWGPPTKCDISNDGSRVAVSFKYNYPVQVGNESPTIAVVDVPSTKVIWKLRGEGHAHNVQLSPDGRFIAFEKSILSPGVKVFQLPEQN